MLYTFQLKTVTEVFTGGADVQKAELRPSTFRGPLRFWFRAMMGKIVGNDLERLKRLEASAFGATDVGSPFMLRLAHLPESTSAGGLIAPPPSIGKNYLAYALYTQSNSQTFLARGCVPANQTFTLSLHFRRPDQALQDVVLGSFWLLINFGGIGSRSRRGFGALSVRSVELNKKAFFNYFSLTGASTDIQRLYRIGQALVEEQFRKFAEQNSDEGSGQPALLTPNAAKEVMEYASFTDWTARLIMRRDAPAGLNATDDWFRQWGIILRSFRNGTRVSPDQDNVFQPFRRTTSDYRKVISHSMDGLEPSRSYLENDVIGLPIVFQSGTRHGARRTLAWRGASKEKEGRRASPLFLHPVLLPSGQVAALATFFVSRFLPDGAEIPIDCPSGEPLSPASSADIRKTAEDFFEYLDGIFKPRRGQAGDLFIAMPELQAGGTA